MCSNPHCAELDTCLVCRKGNAHLFEGASFGAEILDSSADVEDDGFLTVRGLDNGGCYAGLEFFGGDPGTND